MSHEQLVKLKLGRTQRLILKYVESTDKKVFRAADVAKWLKEQDIKVSRRAVYEALKRLEGIGLARRVGDGFWTIDVSRIASITHKERRVSKESSTNSSSSSRDVDSGVGDNGGPGLDILFDNVVGYINGKLVTWTSKDRGGRKLSLSDLSRFDSVSYCEVDFAPLSLQRYKMDGMFSIHYARDVDRVIAEFKPYEGVVKRLGVDETVKRAAKQLAKVVTYLFIDLLHHLSQNDDDANYAAKLLGIALKNIPKRLLNVAYGLICSDS